MQTGHCSWTSARPSSFLSSSSNSAATLNLGLRPAAAHSVSRSRHARPREMHAPISHHPCTGKTRTRAGAVRRCTGPRRQGRSGATNLLRVTVVRPTKSDQSQVRWQPWHLALDAPSAGGSRILPQNAARTHRDAVCVSSSGRPAGRWVGVRLGPEWWCTHAAARSSQQRHSAARARALRDSAGAAPPAVGTEDQRSCGHCARGT